MGQSWELVHLENPRLRPGRFCNRAQIDESTAQSPRKVLRVLYEKKIRCHSEMVFIKKSEPLAAGNGAACGGARGQGGFVMV